MTPPVMETVVAFCRKCVPVAVSVDRAGEALRLGDRRDRGVVELTLTSAALFGPIWKMGLPCGERTDVATSPPVDHGDGAVADRRGVADGDARRRVSRIVDGERVDGNAVAEVGEGGALHEVRARCSKGHIQRLPL